MTSLDATRPARQRGLATGGFYRGTEQRARTQTYKVDIRPSLKFDWEEHEDVVTVTETQTGIFGSGDDIVAALRDVRAALREHLDVLDRAPELSPGLAEQRDYLRARLS